MNIFVCVVNFLHFSAFFGHLQGGTQQKKSTTMARYIIDVQ